MPDEVSVCNQAIGELGGGEFGAPRIQGFQDGTSLSSLCGDAYPGARDEVLELHNWNFATAFKRLTSVPPQDNPVPDLWRYMYPLPVHPYCIKVRGTDEGLGAKYQIATDDHAGRVIFSNADRLIIEYTKRVEDLGVWSPLAVDILVKFVASKLAKALTGQDSLTQLKIREAQLLLPEARNSDSEESGPVVLRPNLRLVRARHRWGGGGVNNPERVGSWD